MPGYVLQLSRDAETKRAIDKKPPLKAYGWKTRAWRYSDGHVWQLDCHVYCPKSKTVSDDEVSAGNEDFGTCPSCSRKLALR